VCCVCVVRGPATASLTGKLGCGVKGPAAASLTCVCSCVCVCVCVCVWSKMPCCCQPVTKRRMERSSSRVRAGCARTCPPLQASTYGTHLTTADLILPTPTDLILPTPTGCVHAPTLGVASYWQCVASAAAETQNAPSVCIEPCAALRGLATGDVPPPLPQPSEAQHAPSVCTEHGS